MMVARHTLLLGVAGLLAFESFRLAVVQSPAESRPIDARLLWPGHPAIEREIAMARIGAVAATQQQVPADARRTMAEVARKDPFTPDPFLVEGTAAQVEGRSQQAERLFQEARARNPRSAAARYFLAGRYLQTGRIEQGIDELAALSGIIPGAANALVPALVAYSKTPGSAPKMREFFRSAPDYRDAVLAVLAQDSANAERVVALAGPTVIRPAPPWQGQIVSALIEKGEYGRAQRLWRRLSGAPAYHGLFNPTFRALDAPPPFNWTLQSGEAGLVEPAREGGLQLLYYGRKDAVLASQVTLFGPGRYRLTTQVTGASDATALTWSLSCLPQGTLISRQPLTAVGGSSFVVPQGCPAQRIELRATAADDPRQVQFRVLRIDLVGVGEP